MDIDAALLLFSFASFVVLLVGWMLAPMRADTPPATAVVESASPRTAVAA
jgi:hypothetical protein